MPPARTRVTPHKTEGFLATQCTTARLAWCIARLIFLPFAPTGCPTPGGVLRPKGFVKWPSGDRPSGRWPRAAFRMLDWWILIAGLLVELEQVGRPRHRGWLYPQGSIHTPKRQPEHRLLPLTSYLFRIITYKIFAKPQKVNPQKVNSERM